MKKGSHIRIGRNKPITRALTLPAVLDANWRATRFGYWTGSADVRWLRSECRYEWAKHTLLARFFFTRIAPKQIWLFRPDTTDRLTFHAPNGVEMTIGTMETDMGSVPRLLQPIISQDQYLRSYLGHDFEYQENGAFFRRPFRHSEPAPSWIPTAALEITEQWHFVEMTQRQADDFLYTSVGAENGLAWQRGAIWSAVRAAGWAVWKKRQHPQPYATDEQNSNR